MPFWTLHLSGLLLIKLAGIFTIKWSSEELAMFWNATFIFTLPTCRRLFSLQTWNRLGCNLDGTFMRASRWMDSIWSVDRRSMFPCTSRFKDPGSSEPTYFWNNVAKGVPCSICEGGVGWLGNQTQIRDSVHWRHHLQPQEFGDMGCWDLVCRSWG